MGSMKEKEERRSTASLTPLLMDQKTRLSHARMSPLDEALDTRARVRRLG
jgi:hypothetical protein